MQGKIVKGIAGFYYVHVVGFGIYECKAKGSFRKEKRKPLVGDNVEIDCLSEEEKTGNIIQIFPRKNELIRPAVANIDQALVVFAVTDPKPHFNLLDRFLIMMETKGIPAVLCFNKQDIATEKEIQELQEIYRRCGYQILFTSAKKEENIALVKEVLKGKTTTVAGPSGVGKSSLINILQPEILCIGGGLSGAGEALLAPVKEKTAPKIYSRASQKNTRIRLAEMGNGAGIIGAACLNEQR